MVRERVLVLFALVAIPGTSSLALAQLPPTLTEETEFGASDGEGGDDFGATMALWGSTALVGSPSADLGSTGFDHGAVYVFEEGPIGAWTEVVQLTASPPSSTEYFGLAVALQGDTALVGVPNDWQGGLSQAGSTYVFERDLGGPDAWGQAALLTGSSAEAHDAFGCSVSISGDRIAVGAGSAGFFNYGAAYVFELDQGQSNTWVEQVRLTASDAIPGGRFGESLGIEGDTLAVGAPGMHAVYVFERNPAGSWIEIAKLSGPNADRFGEKVVVAGGLIAVGAPGVSIHPGSYGPGSVYVYEKENDGLGAWVNLAQLNAWDPLGHPDFGTSVAIDGDRILAGAIFAPVNGLMTGAAYLFDRQGNEFWPVSKLQASDASYADEFGQALAASAGRALIGAPGGSLGPPFFEGIDGLAYDPLSGTLYGVEEYSDQLVTLDTGTAIGTYVGALGFGDCQGLAFDVSTATLYACDTGTDELLVVDPTTGAATAVGALGFGNVQGLAFDAPSASLYGVDTLTDQLLIIDPLTGAATSVGPVGFDAIRGLDFDAESGELYGSDPNDKLLIRIDTLTGAGVVVGTFGPTGIEGLADQPGAGFLYACNGSPKKLFSVKTSNAATTLIGVYSSPQPGTVYVLDYGNAPSTYCTAGTSASGCQALLSAVGTASATAPSGFTLEASTVEGSKDGLFFFGTNGQQANPWGNGSSYQCVVPPVVRTPTMVGVGTIGLCDGSFALDLNALWCPSCPKPAKNPGAAAVVQAQLWYRDPLGTSNQTTSLSDAIEFVVAP